MLRRINNAIKEKLIEKYKNIVFDDDFQFVSDISTECNNFANSSNPNYIEFVSIYDEDVVGYLFARTDGNNPKIAHISNCINFEKKQKNVFGSDLRAFIRLLKKHGIQKLEWAVWEGNPAKQLYDKISNVRYVGYYSNAVIHRGKEINIHLYELFLTQRATDGEH